MPSISTSFLIALLRASGDGLVMRWVCNEQNEPCWPLCLKYTAISNVHATIPKGNMGYDQHTVRDTVAVELRFVAFL